MHGGSTPGLHQPILGTCWACRHPPEHVSDQGRPVIPSSEGVIHPSATWVCAQRGRVFPLEDVLRKGLGDNHFLYLLLMPLTAEYAVSVGVEAASLGGIQVSLDLLAEVICLLGRGQLGQRKGQRLGILRAAGV